VIQDYLTRLGLPRERPSVGYLRALHRAQVSTVPYTNLEIMLGRPGSVDPAASTAQVLAGRGGYCFQLNGAFGELLRALGFRVTLHRGYVLRHTDVEPTQDSLNHLALMVHDLPEESNPGGVWVVDAGLGDALHEPLPLVSGVHPQGPFSYGLTSTLRSEPGWRLVHDPSGSFAACDIVAAPAVIGDFAAAHQDLSTSPTSPFTRLFTAQLRTGDAVQALRGCALVTTDAHGRRQTLLDTVAHWCQALADVFGLVTDELDQLWPRVRADHEVWLAQRAEQAA
jgi:arylamine N-acetyltransferase